jgi:hypothetical protein
MTLAPSWYHVEDVVVADSSTEAFGAGALSEAPAPVAPTALLDTIAAIARTAMMFRVDRLERGSVAVVVGAAGPVPYR